MYIKEKILISPPALTPPNSSEVTSNNIMAYLLPHHSPCLYKYMHAYIGFSPCFFLLFLSLFSPPVLKSCFFPVLCWETFHFDIIPHYSVEILSSDNCVGQKDLWRKKSPAHLTAWVCEWNSNKAEMIL